MLTEGFADEEIACYHFVRQVPQWQRVALRPDFETYMQRKMTRRTEMLGWDVGFSPPHLIAIYEGIYDKRFDRTETRFFYEQSVGCFDRGNIGTQGFWLAAYICSTAET